MHQSIAKEFSFKELIKFAFPSIIMMIFLSLYTIIDGFFVSRFVGTNALSAVNITYPLTSIIIAIGVMFASGGSAIVAIRMGAGKTEKAKKDFTLITLTAVIISIFIATVSLIYIDPIIRFLGAKGELIPLCRDYIVILLIFSPLSVLQMLFQSFLVTAGHPKLGLILTAFGGILNIVFDYILIVPMDMGVRGAAYATAMGYCVPAIGGLIFFFKSKRNGLHFSKPSFDFNVLKNTLSNGSSEMVTNLSGSVTTLLFNIFMIKLSGSDGVAAITVVLYCQFLMTSLFLGFSMGVAPIISYHYGAGNEQYLKKVFKICSYVVGITSIMIFIFSLSCSNLISSLFSPTNLTVQALSARGLKIFSISFVFAGINIFASALFTALGNGKISALLSFSRTFLFTILGIIVLSTFYGIDGIWLSIPTAEFITVIFALLSLKILKSQYRLF